MAQVTFPDKDNTLALDHPNRLLTDDNVNEIKNVINTNQNAVSSVNNTSDADKPVSTAQASAIAVVQTDLNTHKSNTSNPHAVTKSQVGLSNVENISINGAITAAINALIGGAPGALDTLNELAAALGDDASFAAAVTSSLAGKQPLDSDLTFISGLSPQNDDFLQKKAGQWTNRTIAQVQTDLAMPLSADFVWGEIPSGTVDGVNDDFVIANSSPSKVALYIDGIRTNPSNFSITGTALTITNAAVIPTNSILIDYIK